MKYTPRVKGTNERLKIMNPQFSSGFRHGWGLGYKGTVTDPATSKIYKIYGAACGLPKCQCDALAVQITYGEKQ